MLYLLTLTDMRRIPWGWSGLFTPEATDTWSVRMTDNRARYGDTLKDNR